MPARRKATTRKIVLIGGSYYAGEMKKSVFATLNYYLPEKGVMPMHCSANPLWHRQDHARGRSDAHADWPTTRTAGARTASSISKAAATPMHQAVEGSRARDLCRQQARFGAVLENVVLDANTREPDFDDSSMTENTRSAYPLEFIPNASRSGRAGHPKNLVMLAADVFRVMLPIAKLTPARATSLKLGDAKENVVRDLL
jgi:phosphoenolpyruvate carboxykinase (ATP)